jgi:signal transduction histidine kinase
MELTTRVQSLAASGGWGPVVVDDPLLIVQADPRRLDRIVSSLVRNAQTHGGGRVRVAVLRRDGSGVIEVDDAGPGAPASDRECIFERFTRGEPQSGAGHPPGIGLGLAFVAELVTLQHGEVTVRDRPGGSARFVVQLPLATT